MAPRRAPKRAEWRRHRVWPWALAALALGLGLALALRNTLAPAPRPLPSPSVGALLEDAGRPAEGALRTGTSLPTVAVVDVHGAPVADCVVELRAAGEKREATPGTAAEACAAVELPEVPPGDYLLAAEAPGYQRRERPVHLAPGPSALRLNLPEGVALSGQVVGVDGRPLPGVSVVAFPTEGATRTNALGAFRLAVPSPGAYRLEAHHSDWGGARQAVTAPGAAVLLKLEPHAVLQLDVHSGGQPVGGAQAVLFTGKEPGVAAQYAADRATDADGGVRLEGFPAGTYTLEVSAPGTFAPVRQQVVLRESAPTAVSVAMAPVPAGALEGVVVDEEGQPVAAASVRVSAGDVPAVQSDAEGHFRLEGLTKGVKYAVSAAQGAVTSLPRHAHSGENGLRLVVPRPRVYRGRVVDEASQPVPVFRVDEVEVEAPSGRFALSLPARGGLVTLRVEAPPLALATLVRPAAVEELGDVVLHRAPLVQGEVEEPDGGPAAEALVLCEGCRGEASAERHLTTFSDVHGHFTLAVTGPFGVLVRLLAVKDGQLGWGEAGRVGEAVRLVLGAPSLVRGRVVRPTGEPAPAVAVAFVEPLLEPLFLVTGRDGSFAGEVPPGLYQLTLLPDGSRPRRTWTVQVPTERPLELVAGPAAP